jgi:hypothetical protein
VTGDDRELRLESISSRFIGGRSLALTGQPVEEVALSSALPGYQHDGNDTYYIAALTWSARWYSSSRTACQTFPAIQASTRHS